MKNTQIFFCGDTHGNFAHVIEAVRRYRPAAIVFLGDLQPQRPLEQELQKILDLTEIWWIHGNHDTDSQADHDNLFLSALADRNLHGRVMKIAGARIAGLGGVFRSEIWYPPDAAKFDTYGDYLAAQAWRQAPKSRTAQKRERHGHEYDDEQILEQSRRRTHLSSIFPDAYCRLAVETADILVTHEAPSCHPHGFDAIDELARSLGARTVFHGHQHDRLDYASHCERIGFNAYGVGFCGITDQDSNIICTGDFDEQRAYRQERVSGGGE